MIRNYCLVEVNVWRSCYVVCWIGREIEWVINVVIWVVCLIGEIDLGVEWV